MPAPSSLPDLRRLLRQQLESWHAAGVGGLRRSARIPASEPLAEAPSASSADAASASNRPNSPAPIAESSMPRPASRPTPKTESPSRSDAPPAGTLAPAFPLPLPADRGQALEVLSAAVRNCTRCEELARTRTQTVFGVGNPHAKIVFLGEAPGADEDAQGEPFVGRAGQLLNQIMAACRIKREEIYICNVLKCRPPENRTPLPDECGNCREFLEGQLATIDPDYIVCWGAVAAQNLLKTDVALGKLRRSFHRHGRAKVLCTYHPAYLLRNPPIKKDVWDDMKLLFADMGIDLTRKD
jgi:DNA polymerase